MKIKRLDFKDLRTGWHLEDARFDDFNLLVGASGVGKTKVVEALRKLARLAWMGEMPGAAVEWVVDFEHDKAEYSWAGRIERSSAPGMEMLGGPPGEEYEIVCERVLCDGQEVVLRNKNGFLFEGRPLPRLSRTESAMKLLENEASIQAARSALFCMHFSAGNDVQRAGVRVRNREKINELLTVMEAQVEAQFPEQQQMHDAARTIFTFVLVAAGMATTELGYVMQRFRPEIFARVKERFIDVFPSVRDLKVAFADELRGGDEETLEIAILEQGVDTWIAQPEMSSGMLRVFGHLLEFETLPSGSVVIIDEFENSLGGNCLPQITDLILSRAPELQFILTSHHPYVINNIPIETWKLVQRRGSTVRLKSARDIPALTTRSHHDAFIRLLNTREFEEGILPPDTEKGAA